MNERVLMDNWVRGLGYTKPIPLELSRFCNTSTNHVWEQLMDRIRPVKEVERTRANVLLNRLKNEANDDSLYPLKELKQFEKLNELKHSIKYLEESLRVNNEQSEKLTVQCKSKGVILQNLIQKCNEMQEKKFILEKKIMLAKQEICELNAILKATKHHNVEDEEAHQLNMQLEECGGKIQKLIIAETEKLVKQKRIKQNAKATITSLTYFDQLEDEITIKIAPSCKKLLKQVEEHVLVKETVQQQLFVNNSCIQNDSSLGILSLSTSFQESFYHSESLNLETKLYNIADVQEKMQQLIQLDGGRMIDLLLKHWSACNRNKWNTLYLPEIALNKSKFDFAPLKGVHIKTHLQAYQERVLIDNLVNKVHQRKKEILESFGLRRVELEDRLEAKIVEIGLKALLEAVSFELSAPTFPEQRLVEVEADIAQLQEDIDHKTLLAKRLMEILNDTTFRIESYLKALPQAASSLSVLQGAAPILEGLNEYPFRKEIEVFADFPLEFEKRTPCARDMCINTGLDEEQTKLLVETLRDPFKAPELILINIIKEKTKMEILKSMETESLLSQHIDKNYTLDSLNEQENYIQYALDKLKCLTISEHATETMAIKEMTRKSLSIWLEMPFRRFISKKRLHKGQPYQYFEQKLNKYL